MSDGEEQRGPQSEVWVEGPPEPSEPSRDPRIWDYWHYGEGMRNRAEGLFKDGIYWLAYSKVLSLFKLLGVSKSKEIKSETGKPSMPIRLLISF